MKRFALLVLALIPVWVWAQATIPDFGGYTPCGVVATGIDPTIRDKANPNGKSVTAARPGMAVSPEGKWFTCQNWIAQGGDPRTPEPTPEKTCPAKTVYETWESGGRVCTSIPPGVFDGNTSMLQETKPGRIRLITSDKSWTQMGKATWGFAVYRCVVNPDGSVKWQEEPGAFCKWAND
jgi:hypothetical protein